ncbi:MAG TPA: TetR/AcrR family transcriptional regulator [Chloroflexota bacterium]|nr:TetR/AcrR family transcriptional regulator [Chloroflexota bacterium]
MGSAEVTHSRRADAVANHARILEAASLVLVERGLDMEMDEVALRAGVGVGTLYRHFANRDAMVQAILAQTFEGLLTHLRAAAAIEDPSAALREIPFTLVTLQSVFPVLRDPRCTKLMHDMKHEMSRTMVDEITALVSGIVERGARSGAFRADLDPAATASAILGSIGAVLENLGTKRPLLELAEVLADLHHGMVTARR